jgi:hypothetical protein
VIQSCECSLNIHDAHTRQFGIYRGTDWNGWFVLLGEHKGIRTSDMTLVGALGLVGAYKPVSAALGLVWLVPISRWVPTRRCRYSHCGFHHKRGAGGIAAPLPRWRRQCVSLRHALCGMLQLRCTSPVALCSTGKAIAAFRAVKQAPPPWSSISISISASIRVGVSAEGGACRWAWLWACSHVATATAPWATQHSIQHTAHSPTVHYKHTNTRKQGASRSSKAPVAID